MQETTNYNTQKKNTKINMCVKRQHTHIHIHTYNTLNHSLIVFLQQQQRTNNNNNNNDL